MSGLRNEIDSTADNILKTVGAGMTAWELKMKLKVSHTKLHLALGMLVERGRVSLRPENLTLLVMPTEASHAPKPGEARHASGSSAPAPVGPSAN